jgi:hypothetical protein
MSALLPPCGRSRIFLRVINALEQTASRVAKRGSVPGYRIGKYQSAGILGLEDPNARPRRVRCSFGNSHQRHEAALTRHADDQLLDLSADPRPSRASTGVRAIKFVGDELAVPSQNNGVWSGHIRHLGESLAA